MSENEREDESWEKHIGGFSRSSEVHLPSYKRAFYAGHESQHTRIKELKARVGELEAWKDFACQMYLTSNEKNEINVAILFQKHEARAALSGGP